MFYNLFAQWHWFIVAFLLLIIEVTVGSSGFLLTLGVSAAMVGIIVYIIPSMAWTLQTLLFSAIGILIAIIWWAYLKWHPTIQSDEVKLNLRSEQYIGRTFTLVQAIENGRGKIRIDDTVWIVQGPNLPAGEKVKIIRAEGVILIAEKLSS